MNKYAKLDDFLQVEKRYQVIDRPEMNLSKRIAYEDISKKELIRYGISLEKYCDELERVLDKLIADVADDYYCKRIKAGESRPTQEEYDNTKSTIKKIYRGVRK